MAWRAEGKGGGVCGAGGRGYALDEAGAPGGLGES